MAQFYYEAIGADGQKSKGTLDAANRSQAVQNLENRGLQAFVLEDRGTAAAPKKGASSTTKAASKGSLPLKQREVIEFTEELSDLLHAGMQLEPALRSMADRDAESNLKKVIAQVADSVREGGSFSQALRQASPSFGELYCTLAHAGEVSGALPKILRRQGEHLRVLHELRGKVANSLIYPAFLVVTGIAVCALFMTYLVPRLAEMLTRSGAKLPPLASGLIQASEFTQSYGLYLLGGVVLLGLLIWQILASKAFRPTRDRLQLQLPVAGPILKLHFQVRFLETLGNLLQNGLPLLRSLQLMESATQNLFLQAKLKRCVEQVTDGMSLSRALQLSGTFPKQLTDMLRVGEQTGQLGSTLARIGDKYDRELTQRIGNISTVIQPVIILIMAGLVGTMAYIMISVIYDTVSTLRTR